MQRKRKACKELGGEVSEDLSLHHEWRSFVDVGDRTDVIWSETISVKSRTSFVCP